MRIKSKQWIVQIIKEMNNRKRQITWKQSISQIINLLLNDYQIDLKYSENVLFIMTTHHNHRRFPFGEW